MEQAFVDAASRAKRAGFDAVELHMGHGYLIHSFLTPLANNRDDHYGGNLANRARLALEIIGKVRGVVKEDYPVLCKISGSDYAEGGLTLKAGDPARHPACARHDPNVFRVSESDLSGAHRRRAQ